MTNTKYKVLILASYCGGDNENCSEDFPCADCMDMCNVAETELHNYKIFGGFDYLKRNLNGGLLND